MDQNFYYQLPRYESGVYNVPRPFSYLSYSTFRASWTRKHHSAITYLGQIQAHFHHQQTALELKYDWTTLDFQLTARYGEIIPPQVGLLAAQLVSFFNTPVYYCPHLYPGGWCCV
jgi:hypothetical protein